MVETAVRTGRVDRAREELIANIMAIPAVLALGIAIFDFFWRGSGISGTAGAGLAIFGCAALTFAAILIGRLGPGALRTTFVVLILIGAVLTALAAWFLESGWVMAGMFGVLLCWAAFVMAAR